MAKDTIIAVRPQGKLLRLLERLRKEARKAVRA